MSLIGCPLRQVLKSGHVLEDIFVGEVPARFRKRHDVLPKLIEAQHRQLPAKRVADDLAAAAAEGVGHLAELSVEVLVEADGHSGFHGDWRVWEKTLLCYAVIHYLRSELLVPTGHPVTIEG